ncbi:MAG TPA: ABC transporter permease [Jatrophihabitantaceae bacterium]|nr:ABC transporter permease [Jatrophihabitantaceae bacterium]
MSDSNTWSWLFDGANWRNTYGQTGIATQLANHVEYSAIALGIAVAIGLPLGLVIGHTCRAAFLVSVVNGVRALPSIGLLVLFYVILAPHFHGRGNGVFLIPTEIVLILLAIPPILANTYAGVQNVGDAARDAARGMGMTGGQVLWKVEFPNALPLIFSGFRSATLQVISTATVAAYVGLGGLGRFVYDGLASHDFPQVVSGAILVAVLALVADLALALVQRYATSRGVTGRFARTRGAATPGAVDGAVEQLEVATT